jgi:thiamine-monophosphate kinase
LKKLSTLGEFGLISQIASVSHNGTGVITGIGDDAAVTQLTPGMQLLTSTDMLLEDVHFRRVWHDPYLLGRKALAVNISDIAAMGGIPRWALLSLAIPADLPIDFLDQFTRGFLGMADEHGVSLIGGDTCSSRSGLAISVTIMGEQFPDRIVRRSGAVVGDNIWVTGTLGDAALGLKLLECGLDSAQPPGCSLSGVEGRLLNPSPRVLAGQALAESGLVSTMIDISDGVLADFGHIAEQSCVGGLIHIERLPLSINFKSLASGLAADPYLLALSGGEDYELCFTAPQANRGKIVDCMKKCGIAVTPVGIVTNPPMVQAVHEDGSPYETKTEGFNHFT